MPSEARVGSGSASTYQLVMVAGWVVSAAALGALWLLRPSAGGSSQRAQPKMFVEMPAPARESV